MNFRNNAIYHEGHEDHEDHEGLPVLFFFACFVVQDGFSE